LKFTEHWVLVFWSRPTSTVWRTSLVLVACPCSARFRCPSCTRGRDWTLPARSYCRRRSRHRS